MRLIDDYRLLDFFSLIQYVGDKMFLFIHSLDKHEWHCLHTLCFYGITDARYYARVYKSIIWFLIFKVSQFCFAGDCHLSNQIVPVNAQFCYYYAFWEPFRKAWGNNRCKDVNKTTIAISVVRQKKQQSINILHINILLCLGIRNRDRAASLERFYLSNDAHI